jgi:hypothetical protein
MPERRDVDRAGGMYCRGCGCDLGGQGAAARRCPQCGREFDPGAAGTFGTRPRVGAGRLWARRVVAGLLILCLVLGSAWGWLYWGWRGEQRALATLYAGPVTREPLGGKDVQTCLGPAGWVLDRVTSVALQKTTTDADLAGLVDLKGLWWLDLSGTQVTDAGLVHLKALKRLQLVKLDGTRVTGGRWGDLGGLTELRELSLSRTAVTDGGLAHLGELAGLRALYLNGTKVTDAGLAELKTMAGLQRLYLNDTPVTDAGLARLKDLPGLEVLELSGTAVTDAGVMQLRDLRRLQELDLSGTKVTEAGARALQNVLPWTHIER